MKILNSIALMLSMTIMINNNSYTSDIDNSNEFSIFNADNFDDATDNQDQNNNQNQDNDENEFSLHNIINMINDSNIDQITTEMENLQSNYNDSYNSTDNSDDSNIKQRNKIVHFKNESGDKKNLCSLASLNQCLSTVNHGNNKLLKDFIQKYNELGDDLYDPSFIFEELLKDVNSKEEEILLSSPDLDIAERYDALANISKMRNCDISDVVNYIHFWPDGNEVFDSYLNECNKLNIVVDNDVPNNMYLTDIVCANEEIKANGNTYDLVSISFVRVNEDGKPVENNSTHYISAKRQSNGKWILIDSLFPGKTEKFDNLKALINKYVNNYNEYELDPDKAHRRFMPKLLFFTKQQ